MSSILERTVGTEVDKRLVLTNEQFGRTMSIGSDWTTLRIGIRWFINRSTAWTNAPLLFFGICSGKTNMYADSTTTNFLGRHFVGSFDSVRFDGVDVMRPVTAFYLVKKVGTTITNLDTSAASTCIGASEVRRFVAFMQITKGDPNYRIYTWGTVGNSGLTDNNYSTFYDIMTSASTPPITFVRWGGANYVDVAVDEVAGVFDTLNVGWYGESSSLEISDIAYNKIA